ncbi:MAG: ClpP family protease [Planctomycetota bacterium]
MPENPKVLLPDAKDVKAVDIGACLLEQRILYFSHEVNARSVNAAVQQILYLQDKDPAAPIRFYLNSPGGSVIDGMALYDVIQRSSCPVHCTVTGMAASMGAVILSGCEKGERAIMPHGEVLLHQPLGGAEGPATEIEISAQRIIKTKEMLLALLAENCGQPYEKLAEDCDRDYWLDAEDALAYGIVDKII